ncbi:MAG: DUF2079 domain-containing protein [bacterium]|nr:DUF2079 domain-containing protein [bacterium]
MKKRFPYLVPGILLVSFAVVSVTFMLQKLNLGLYNALDLAIFNQIFWKTTHGSFFGLTIHPQISLGDHMELFILLLAPIYAVFSSPITLLVIQLTALVITPIPLLLLIKEKGKGGPLTTFVLSIFTFLWILNPFMHNALLFEFHIYTLAPPLITWTYYFYRKEHLNLFWLFFVLLLSIREDLALTAFMFPVIALIERRSWKWWLTPALVSVSWFFIAIGISGLFNPGGGYKFFAFYEWLGDNPTEIAIFILSHPIAMTKHLLLATTLKPAILLLGSGLFLSIFSPAALLLAVPVFLVGALSQVGLTDAFLFYHYQIIFITAVFIASAEGFVKLMSGINRSKYRQAASIYFRIALVLFSGLWVLYSWSYSGLNNPITDSISLFRISQQQQNRELLSEIQDTDAVMAGTTFLTELSGREMVHTLHYTYIGKLQFSEVDFPLPNIDSAIIDSDEILRLLVSNEGGQWYKESLKTGSGRLRAYLSDQGLFPVKTIDTAILYKKEGEPVSLYTITEMESTTSNLAPHISRAVISQCNKKLCLDAETWSPDHGPDVVLRLELYRENKLAWFAYYLPAYGIHVPHELLNASTISTNWNIANPRLSKGEYTARLILEPTDGHHLQSSIRHAIYAPSKETTSFSEVELDPINFNEAGDVASVGRGEE